MGDWMTVRIVGTCNRSELLALQKAIDWDRRDFDAFHCLSHTGGISGLPMWARENIDVVGNCAERDYTPDSVAKTLQNLSKIAPSLNVKVHCGGPYESESCIATVTLEKGVATVGDPEIEAVGEISEAQMTENFWKQMLRQAQ